MKIYESTEDYLEALFVLSQEKGMVRAIDIANYLNYSKPSVSVAMKKFRENQLVDIDDDGHLFLTKKGLPIAEKTLEKHNIIAQILISLGVSRETALQDACHIEHCLSDESFSAIKAHWQADNK